MLTYRPYEILIADDPIRRDELEPILAEERPVIVVTGSIEQTEADALGLPLVGRDSRSSGR